MSDAVFIYALTSSRDDYTLPWYIGQTVDCQHRLADHRRECYQNKTRQAKWTKTERDAGFTVAIRIIAEATRDTADDAEEQWITKMREVNPNLVNTTNGNHKQARREYLAKVQKTQREQMATDATWLQSLLTEKVGA